MAYKSGTIKNFVEDAAIKDRTISELKGRPWSIISSSYKAKQLEFRISYSTIVYSTLSGSTAITNLHWGDSVEVNISGTNPRVPIKWFDLNGNKHKGFVSRKSVVVLMYICPGSVKKFRSTKDKDKIWGEQKTQFRSDLYKLQTKNDSLPRGQKDPVIDVLLWGDVVHLISKGRSRSKVSARGKIGWVKNDDLSAESLLEIYFIDVGQGDGVLVCDPDRKHIMIDGGISRSHQQTGRNAADFVDWKFFTEYAGTEINLDAMVASHCDADHYGGLIDLLSTTKLNTDKLDSSGVTVGTLYHAGLSYWYDPKSKPRKPNKWLGPSKNWSGEGVDNKNSFVASSKKPARVLTNLLGESVSVEDALKKASAVRFQGKWKTLFEQAKKRGVEKFQRLGVGFNDVSNPKYMGTWDKENETKIRVLGPVTLEKAGEAVLPDFESNSQNTNGHSILLRIDYKDARISLTGDLNRNSMNFLARAYKNNIEELASDVAKACHHGSGDISFKFLNAVKAGATIISSGDAEGYAHPRPDVVGASAMTGYKDFDEMCDHWVTPLVYSTEIERSISLGHVKHLSFGNLPKGRKKIDGKLFAQSVRKPGKNAKQDHIDHYNNWEINQKADTRATYSVSYLKGVWSKLTGVRDFEDSRTMESVHYGLINVRTDGKIIMCSTKRETGEGWTIHIFKSRFNDASVAANS